MTYSDCAFDKDGKFSEFKISDQSVPLPLESEITWNLLNESDDLLRKRQIKAIKRAFLRIGQVIPVKFKFLKESWTPNESDSEIQITVSNSDNYFKTRPNALAYAFVGTTSQEIDLVFNESYFWTLNREVGNNRYDMEVVVIHELLHVLGLSHSIINDSVMFPNYQGIYDMNEVDINNLQLIWGVRSGWSRRLLWLKGYFQRLL